MSIVFYCSINHHSWKTTSTSTLINMQLRKMVLKKISLSWWTTRSLVSLFYFWVYLLLRIDSFIVFHSLQVNFYPYFYLLLCIYSVIDFLIAGKIFIFIFFLFLCIDSFIYSFITGKTMENLRNRWTVDLVTSEEKLTFIL